MNKQQGRASGPARKDVKVVIMTYNYKESIKEDIKQVLTDGDYDHIVEQYSDYMMRDGMFDDLYNELYNAMWVDDRITGNASGSYTFDRYVAGEYLNGNDDLLRDAYEAFGCDIDYDAESRDVTIRCYLLSECLREVLEDEKARITAN